jgi:hypothetical protein
MYQRLLELIKLIFGKSAINKTIGTRTNVIQLPNNKTKRYTKQDLDIESASDAAAMNAKKEMEELIAEIPKMNDAERLIFEGNLQRLKNRLGLRSETDPTADVFEFGTKEKVTPGGIASLTEKAGQKSPPGTIIGNIESRLNKLRASGEDLSTMKGQTLDEIMGDVMQTQKTMSKMQDEGLVRAAVRYKMMDDLKRGTLKLPKNLEDVVRGASNEEDVITVFRNNYGEDALEQVDSLIPDFYKMTSPADAVKKIEKDFPNMKPKKIEVKQTMDLDEATKAEQENILTPGKAIPADSPEGKKITEALIGKPKAEVVSLPTAEKILSDMRNLGPIDAMKEANKVLKREGPYKNLTDKDIEKIIDDINDHIFGGDLPVDPEDFATGGRVGYSDGTKPSAEENTPSQEIINRMMAQIKQMSKMGADIDTIKTITGASDQMIKDVLGKASGGSMSTGLDYLMGIDRKNYQQGSAPVDELIINLLNSGSGDGTQSPSTTTSTPSTFQPTMMDMLSLAINPVMGIANIASRTKTGLSLAEQAMDAMGIGRGPGGRTEGYGVDSVNSQSVADQGVSVGDMGGEGGDSGSDSSSSSSASSASDATSPGDTGGAGGADGAGGSDASSGADSAGDGGDGYATGGIVNRTGFKFGTKFGRFWKIARKVWDDINPTGDRKYDAQLVADELAEEIFKTSMDDLPQNVQIDLYALAYNNAPKVDALFRNPQSLSEAAKKGMAASKEMESLGLDVSKNSDFFKYEEMKLSGQLGPEHQVQAYKDKIRDEFYGVIDDTLMKQVEVDDNPQRLAEVYASIKEGLEMQRKGMTPEEIIRVMKQTPRTKNSQGGLNYLMGL